MTSQVVEPVRGNGVRREKSMGLEDVFGDALYGGKDFEKPRRRPPHKMASRAAKIDDG